MLVNLRVNATRRLRMLSIDHVNTSHVQQLMGSCPPDPSSDNEAEQVPYGKSQSQSGKNPQTWFGGRFLPNNEEGFVRQCSDTLQLGKWGNQLMNRFLKTEAYLILKPG